MARGDLEEPAASDRQQARERAFRLLLSALAALLLTFAALAGVLLWYDSANRWVTHTHRVRSNIGDVLQALTDGEAAQRGYLLTGDPQFLRQVAASRVVAEAKASALEALTRDNSEQLRRVQILREAMRTRLAVIERTLALGRAGDMAGAVRVIQGGEGLAAMAVVRALTVELDAAEARLEADRAARAQTVRALVVIALLVFALVLGWLFVKMNRDIGLDRDAEAERAERLAALLQERTLLIDEVNHRVKNSLQQITSVVRLQARALEPGDARDALDKTLSRIMAVGRVHERLYKAEGEFGVFDGGAYAAALAQELVESLAREDIQLSTDVESIELDSRQAAPLALILNELVTNALKYGCPPDRPGKIHVGFRTVGDHHRLSVSDEGDGLPEDFAPSSKKSLGMRAIEALARQLDGRLTIEPSAVGATFVVEFPRSVT